MQAVRGKTMIYGLSGIAGEVFVQVHVPGPPDPQEWNEAVRFIQEAGNRVKCWLVYANGTHVHAVQRRMLNDFYKARGPSFRTGLLTDSAITRTVINLINLMVSSAVIKAFSVAELSQALDYTGLTGDARRTAAIDLARGVRDLALPALPTQTSYESDRGADTRQR